MWFEAIKAVTEVGKAAFDPKFYGMLSENAYNLTKTITDTGFGMAESAVENMLRHADRPRLYIEAINEMRKPAEYANKAEIHRLNSTCSIRDYSDPNKEPDPTIFMVFPPRAGHGSVIGDANFSGDGRQSPITVAKECGLNTIALLDFDSVDVTDTDTGLEHLVTTLENATKFMRDKYYQGKPVQVRLLAECALVYPAIMYACLNKDDISSMVLAGGPIDPQAGNSKVKQYSNINKQFFPWIPDAMSTPIVDGNTMVLSFMAMNWYDRFVGDWKGLWDATFDPDTELGVPPKKLAERTNFGKWYYNGSNLPRQFFKDIQPHFLESALTNGCMMIDGNPICLSDIGPPYIEIILIGGAGDDITDVKDVMAGTQYFQSPRGGTGWKMKGNMYVPTPIENFRLLMDETIMSNYIVEAILPGGHIGLFMSRRNMKYYKEIFSYWKDQNQKLLKYNQTNVRL